MALPKREIKLSEIDWHHSKRLGDGTEQDSWVFQVAIPAFQDEPLVLKVVSELA
jgi:hypothetical protein